MLGFDHHAPNFPQFSILLNTIPCLSAFDDTVPVAQNVPAYPLSSCHKSEAAGGILLFKKVFVLHFYPCLDEDREDFKKESICKVFQEHMFQDITITFLNDRKRWTDVNFFNGHLNTVVFISTLVYSEKSQYHSINRFSSPNSTWSMRTCTCTHTCAHARAHTHTASLHCMPMDLYTIISTVPGTWKVSKYLLLFNEN